MRAEGVKKFGPDFHLSSWKLKDLMPWYVRKPGRETCMCRYHMEFDHFCDALRRWKQAVRKELTPEQAEQCVECPVKPSSNAAALAVRQGWRSLQAGMQHEAPIAVQGM